MIPFPFPTLFLQTRKSVERMRASEPVSYCKSAGSVAHPARLERAACGFEVRRSIQLSYGCALCNELILQSAGQELQPRRERHFG